MTDVDPALRAELTNALNSVSEAVIDGLEDLARTTISDELRADILAQLNALRGWRSLIQAVINGLDQVNRDLQALRDDGYPLPPSVELSPAARVDLEREMAHLALGAGVFTDQALASRLAIAFGEPIPKP